MCGRFTLRTPLTVLAKQFQFELDFPDPVPRYNIAPTQDVAAVRIDDGKRELAILHWGLIPVWAKDKKIAFSTINARGDTVATKPAFRSAFKRRRCLVLADWYYEWQREGKTKLPWPYEVDGGKPFALVGLWEAWHSPGKSEGPPLESCSLITTDANKLAAKVHDRMPVNHRDRHAKFRGNKIGMRDADQGIGPVGPRRRFPRRKFRSGTIGHTAIVTAAGPPG